MFSWKLLAIPAIVIAVIAVALAVIPFSPISTAVAAPPAQEPTPAPINATVRIVPVTMNPKDPNAITGTIKIITDTKVGPSDAVIAMLGLLFGFSGSFWMVTAWIGMPLVCMACMYFTKYLA